MDPFKCNIGWSFFGIIFSHAQQHKAIGTGHWHDKFKWICPRLLCNSILITVRIFLLLIGTPLTHKRKLHNLISKAPPGKETEGRHSHRLSWGIRYVSLHLHRFTTQVHTCHLMWLAVSGINQNKEWFPWTCTESVWTLYVICVFCPL